MVAAPLGPAMPTRGYDVVIVGAGVIGCVAAYRLAPDHDVLVVEKDSVGGDATSRASGALTTPSVYPEAPAIGDHAMAFFREFDGTGTFEFTEREKVQPVRAAAAADARADAERDGVEFVETDTMAERYPDLFVDLSAYVGGLVYEDTGLADPTAYAHSLKHAAEAHGAEFRTDTAVEAVRVDGGRVEGVRTEHGAVEADHVVVATNWYTRDLLAGVLEVPVRPFRWNAMVFALGRDVSHYPIGAETDLEVYWRPTAAGHLLVGGGEHLVDDPTSPPGVTDAFRETVLEEAPSLLADLEGAALVTTECCPTADSATPDTWPIVDAPADGPDGLVVATGFQRGGIMTSPVAGTAVRSLVTGEDPPFDLDHFALDRLEIRSADFDFVSLYDVEI